MNCILNFFINRINKLLNNNIYVTVKSFMLQVTETL